MKPSRAFVRIARRGCCASPRRWMISRRRHEDGRLQGSVNTRSSPSATTDSLRRISIRVAPTVMRSIAFRIAYAADRECGDDRLVGLDGDGDADHAVGFRLERLPM